MILTIWVLFITMCKREYKISILLSNTSHFSGSLLIDVGALITLENNFTGTVAVHGEWFILGFAVPFEENIHEVSSRFEVFELDERISERVRTHFLFAMADHLEVTRVQVVSIKLCWISDFAETDINTSGIIIQVKVHSIRFLSSASFLSHCESGESVAVFWDSKLNQGVASTWFSKLHKWIYSLVIYFADVDLVKNGNHVFISHPENAIIGVGPA